MEEVYPGANGEIGAESSPPRKKRRKKERTGVDTASGRGSETENEVQFLEVAIDGEGEVPKPKRGRKKKESIKPVVQQLTIGVFALLASKHPVWETSPEELDMLVSPLSNILDKKFGKRIAGVSDLVALLLAMFLIFTPRLVLLHQQRKAGKKQDEAEVNPSLPRIDKAHAHSIPGLDTQLQQTLPR